MKLEYLPLVLLSLIAGCFTVAPDAPTNWTIDFGRAKACEKVARYGESVRISSVDVRAPYAGQRIAVLRSDGSIAFDNFNVFAGSPSLMMRGATFDALASSGLFDRVLPSGSVAKAEYSLEIVVTQLALDCRTEGKRTARIAFSLLLVKDREIKVVVHGEGAEEAAGDYSVAFSTAFARAMGDALGKIARK